MLHSSFHNEYLHSQRHVQLPLQSTACSASLFVERMTKHLSLTGHDGCVNTIHFTEDGGHAITGSDDTCIMFFDVNTGLQTERIETIHSNNIFYAKDIAHTNGNELLTCAADGRVVHMHVNEHEFRTLHRHAGRAHRLALMPNDPETFYSCGEDGKCCFYDLRTPTPTLFTTFANQSSYKLPIYMLGINPSKPYEVAIAGGLSRVRTYDARMDGSAWCGEYYPSHMAESSETITGIKYSHSGEEMVLSYNDENIYTVDINKHNKITSSEEDYLHCFKGHRNCQTVKQVTYYGHNSEYVVSGSDCGHIFIWSTDTGDLVKILKGDSIGAINCLTPHPYLPMLGTAGLDRDAKLWLPLGHAARYADMTGSILSAERQEQCIQSLIDANRANRNGADHVFGGTPIQLLRLMGFFIDDDEVDEAGGSGDHRLERNQLQRLMEYVMMHTTGSESENEMESSEESDDSEDSYEDEDDVTEDDEEGGYEVDMQSVESESKEDYDDAPPGTPDLI